MYEGKLPKISLKEDSDFPEDRDLFYDVDNERVVTLHIFIKEGIKVNSQIRKLLTKDELFFRRGYLNKIKKRIKYHENKKSPESNSESD